MFRDIARGYALGRVAASARGTYEGAWRLWVKWREWRERLLARGDRVRDGDCRGFGGVHGVLLRGTGNRETTVAGKLVAVNLFHEQWVGRSPPLNRFRIKAAKEGIKRVTHGGR